MNFHLQKHKDQENLKSFDALEQQNNNHFLSKSPNKHQKLIFYFLPIQKSKDHSFHKNFDFLNFFAKETFYLILSKLFFFLKRKKKKRK